MEINTKLSYTEYTVTTPTTDFAFGFEFQEGVDAVRVLVNNVDALEAGYALRLKNASTMEIQPAVESGVVRIYRETDIDTNLYTFTAGAIFDAANVDANFEQLRHSQQEVRDQFIKLRADTFITLEEFQEENFQELKEYVDGVFGMTNPNLFDGITDNMVIDEFGESQRTNNRSVRQRLTDLEAQQAGTAQKDYVDNLVAPLAVEASVQTRLDAKADITYVDDKVAGVANGLAGTFATLADATAGMAGKPANTSANVTNDPDPTKNGLYRWDGSTLTKSAYDPVSVAASDATTKANNALDSAKAYTLVHTSDAKSVVNYMAQLSGATPLAPVFGAMYPTTGSKFVAAGRYVLNKVAPAATTVRKIQVYAGSAGSQFEVRVYSRASGMLHMEKSVVTLTTRNVGLNTYTLDDFDPFVVAAGQYVGFEVKVNGAVTYVDAAAEDLYWSSSSLGTGDFADTNAGKLHLIIAFYDEPVSRSANLLLDYFKQSSDTSNVVLNNILTYTPSITGLLKDPADATGANAGIGHYVIGVPAIGFGSIKKLKVWSAAAGKADVGVYTRDGRNFTRKRSVSVTLVLGSNTLDVNVPFSKGDYIGLRTYATGAIKYVNPNSNDHQGMFVCTPSADDNVGIAGTDTPIGTIQYQLQFGIETASLSSDAKALKWLGKNYTSFGDSITWYNGRAFALTHLEYGQIAKGYQSYIVEALGCTLDNKGESGWTMPRIYNERIKDYDFSNTYLTTITSGANDQRTGVPVGEIKPIIRDAGVTLDVTTYAGAMQAAIEAVIASNKDTKIVLITPIRGWYNEYGTSDVPNTDPTTVGVLKRAYPDMVKAIAKLYGLPVIDFYDDAELNDLNKNYFLGDNPAVFTAYLLHPMNRFFQRMGEIAVAVLTKY